MGGIKKASADYNGAVAYVVRVNDDGPGVLVPIDDSEFSIGRDLDNMMALPDDKRVSRHHCLIKVAGSRMVIEDLQSTNGTYVNGQRIKGSTPLQAPASLLVGQTRLALVADSPTDEAVSAALEAGYSSPDSIIVPSTSFFKVRTEAFFVVDIVGSSKMVETDASGYQQTIYVMARLLERDLKNQQQSFLKCTGDGFFACFEQAQGALKAAGNLMPGVAKRMQRRIPLSVALHWGKGVLGQGGDRTGKDVHGVFSLEKVRHENQDIENEFRTGTINDVIVMTDEFRSQLAPQMQESAKYCGSYSLKGFEKDVLVFRWVGER